MGSEAGEVIWGYCVCRWVGHIQSFIQQSVQKSYSPCLSLGFQGRNETDIVPTVMKLTAYRGRQI